MKKSPFRKWTKSFGRRVPEIAVLRMSNVEYKLYVKSPKQYLISYRVFRRPPNRVVRCSSTSKSGGSAWMIFIIHVPNSTVSYVAWQT
jgi:hypothetical protein